MKTSRKSRVISACVGLFGGFASLATDCEPIPGGGPCKKCVTSAQFLTVNGGTDLLLCVNKDTKYLGTLLESVDDVPLGEFLAGGGPSRAVAATWNVNAWQEGGPPEPICTDCKAEIVPTTSDTHDLLRVQNVRANLDTTSLEVILTGINGRPFPVLEDGSEQPRFDPIRLDAPNEFLGCTPPSSSNMLGEQLFETADEMPPGGPKYHTSGYSPGSSDPLRPVMAMISYASPLGGLRMCSGVLVSGQHVLTAAHCFPAGTDPSSLRISLGGDGVNTVDMGQDRMLLAEQIVIHPGYEDQLIDLAMVRLTTSVAVPPAVLGTPGLTREDCIDARSYGYGMFGAPSSEPPYYDFGRLQSLKVYEYNKALCADGECLDPSTFIAVTTADMAREALCHGDSGGPLVQVCDGVPYVLGIAAARIQSDSDTFWEELVEYVALHKNKSEPMIAAFAFNQGNVCGSRDAIGFLATRVDAPVTHAWIQSVIGMTSAVGNFDRDHHVDVILSDASKGDVRLFAGGKPKWKAWLRGGTQFGDRLMVTNFDEGRPDRPMVVGLPGEDRWSRRQLLPAGGSVGMILPSIGTKSNVPIMYGKHGMAVMPMANEGVSTQAQAEVYLASGRTPEPLGLVEPTRRASFAGMTHPCGDNRDILTLTLDGHLLYHRDADCTWDAAGSEALGANAKPLNLKSHHEIAWVGELFDATPTDSTDDVDDVVVVRRDLDRTAPDDSAVLFFAGQIVGSDYVLSTMALTSPRVAPDDDVWLGRVDDDEALDLIFVSSSSSRIEYSLYNNALVGYAARQPWPWAPQPRKRPTTTRR